MTVNPVGGSGTEEGRDSACTPKWLADLLDGFIGIDPCSNPRSHVKAWWRLALEWGCNGLLDNLGPGWFKAGIPETGWTIEHADETWTVFCNPPYARGQVIRWIRHWMHTRFLFLLRWDPSTEWFSLLFPRCTHVWFSNRRINFDPPPGVKFSSNPFPHALYMRDPSPDLLKRLLDHGYLLLPLDGSTHAAQSVTHGHDDHAAGAGDRDTREDARGGPEEAGGPAGGDPHDLTGRTRFEGVRW